MRKIGAGVAGGMLAGALVGAIEAIVAWRFRSGGAVLPPIGWAVLVYGLVGAVGGGGIGALARLVGTGAFGLALGAVTAGLGVAAGRFRIVHDGLLEQMPHGLAPTLEQAGALVALA